MNLPDRCALKVGLYQLQFHKDFQRKDFIVFAGKDPAANAIVAGVVGGTASKLSGGDFAHEARTAAFARLGGKVNGADVDLEALGVDLMRAHVRATDLDRHSIPHHLNAEQIQRYHWLNASARAIYCPNCDKPF